MDFEALKTEAAPAEPKSARAVQEKVTKEEGKIDGAVKIAIGVKKEVDFPNWYTNVCCFL